VATFDGDGFIDLAISVPFEDVATARDAGAVSVLYGSAGGPTIAGSQGFWQGTGGATGTAEAGDQFGFALASGDLNGDGFVDLMIGVPFEDVGSVVDGGALSVLYGSAAGLSPSRRPGALTGHRRSGRHG
jgi:FG-GAP repeat